MELVAAAYSCLLFVLLGVPVVFLLYALADVIRAAIKRQPEPRQYLWLLVGSAPILMTAVGSRVVSDRTPSVGMASAPPSMPFEHLSPQELTAQRTYQKNQARVYRERFHVGLTYVIMPRGVSARTLETTVADIEHLHGSNVAEAVAGLHLPRVRVIPGDHNWTRGGAVGTLEDDRYTVVLFFTPRTYKPHRVYVRIVIDGIIPGETELPDYFSFKRIKYDGKNYLKIAAMDRSLWCPRSGSKVLEVVPQPNGDTFLLCAAFTRKVGP